MSTKSEKDGPGADTQRLLSLLQGYRATCLIVTSVQLGLIDQIGASPKRAEVLARSLRTHLPLLRRFLRGLEALGIVRREPAGIGLTRMGKLLLMGASSMADRATLTDEEYWDAWKNLRHTLQTGETAFDFVFGMSAWEHRTRKPELNDCFNRIMTEDQVRTKHAIASAYDFSGCHLVVDVGGGCGHLAAEILAQHPHCTGIVFDQAHALQHAAEVLDATGVRNRCRVEAGSFFDSIPSGGDVYLLQHILHDWDDEHCTEILRRCRAAMKYGSKLLIIENLRMEGTPATESLAMLDLHMMAVLGGRERTGSEYKALLASAGLSPTRRMRTRAHTTILEAIPTASVSARPRGAKRLTTDKALSARVGTLLAINRVYLKTGRYPVEDCLQNIADFQNNFTAEQFLSSLITKRARLERVMALINGLDHIGLVVYGQTIAKTRAAMEAAGFNLGYHAFQSRILSRELATMIRRDSAPTTVLSARGVSANGISMAVEIFLPLSIAIKRVKAWIERSSALHVALRMKSTTSFAEIMRLMMAEGFSPPPFMREGPLTNEAENVAALYFDGRHLGQSLRIEFIASHERG